MRANTTLTLALILAAAGCGGGGKGGKGSASNTGGGPGGTGTTGTVAAPSSTTGTGTGTGSGAVHARAADYGDPSGIEQELLELANRARRDPTAEGQRFGIDLSTYQARPALSYNKFLAEAALAHTTDMASRKFYGHVNPDGIGPNGRILATKYDQHSSYGTDKAANYSENIAAAINALKDAKEVHKAFIVDDSQTKVGKPPKHRNIILGLASWATCREGGFSYNGPGNKANGATYDIYIDQEFSRTNVDKPFVVGVVFEDKNLSGEYDDGEGVAGATITLRAWDGAEVQFKTATAGGYAFEVFDAGEYEVVVTGANVGTNNKGKVTVGADSLKVDGVVNLGVVSR